MHESVCVYGFDVVLFIGRSDSEVQHFDCEAERRERGCVRKAIGEVLPLLDISAEQQQHIEIT